MRPINFPVLLLAWSALFLFSSCGTSDSETTTSNNTNSTTAVTGNASSNDLSSGSANTQSYNINQNGNFAINTQMQRIQEMHTNANRVGARIFSR